MRDRLILVALLLLVPALVLAYGHAAPTKALQLEMQTPAPSGTIVIKFTSESAVTVTPFGLERAEGGRDVTLEETFTELAPTARLSRRFSRPAAALTAERIAAEARYGGALPDLNSYAQMLDVASDRGTLLAVLKAILALPEVESAWLEPVAVPAALGFDAFTGETPTFTESATRSDRDTPDFTGNQGYMNDAPEGVGAWSVTGIPGADGATVQVVDVEGAWLWSHEDLPEPFFEAGNNIDDQGWRNHGTAVLGEIRGSDNGLGVRGIAPACDVGCSSIFGSSTADAINMASAAIAAGDIILIELHGPGPNANGEGQFGYVCMEYWQDNFDAMLLAALNGRIVCEAAGNGAQDLDDPVYDGLFDRNVRNSGAIMCGATDGGSLVPAGFTNYGSRLDLHGWGYYVATCGYGNLHGDGLPEEEWYTDSFSGTSSASPIVVGAVASLQGMFKSAHGFPLDAALAAQILRNTGTPQEGGNLIGPRPNLVTAWAEASVGIGKVAGVITDLDTGLPLAGVRVDVPGGATFRITNGAGIYDIPLIAGDYTLTTESYWYEPTARALSVADGITTTLDIALVAKEVRDITGYIKDLAGNPLAGVRVTPQDPHLAVTLTAADGLFAITSVPDPFQVTVLCDSLPGYGVAAAHFGPGLVTPAADGVSNYPSGGTVMLTPIVEDFEADEGGYFGTEIWSWDSPFERGPEGGFGDLSCWGVGMYDDYFDEAGGYLNSPAYDLSGFDYCLLSFHYWSATEGGFDGVNLRVLNDETWDLVEPLLGYPDNVLGGLGDAPGWSGNTDGWQGVVFDLSDYSGGDLQFRFEFGSDGGVTGEGFWIDAISFDNRLVTAVGDGIIAPIRANLAVWPNPFNPTTTISWSLPAADRMTISIYDVRGRLHKTLLDDAQVESAGTITWRGLDDRDEPLPCGVYLARVTSAGGHEAVTRLVLLK
ncbi:MAG: S8 family serine peptidase [bacterium]|nr:S8 family serine peptidase [bacterium]